ncbi:hypothetical protein B5X24_HaOG212868 [Helicoverpa armigera]|uniref:Uncharacterized protein n=1 Tax=Helicoverpa armigera TaxID=29058 RepID=A0A2W1BFT1_HELAM|nr:hypothetical protein B5X24_HaOG212868 [Helicoverpa armigera]
MAIQREEECEESIFPTGVARHRPEPPGALAQSTRFTPHEIKLMYRGFKQECPSGVVDEEAFKNIFCQFFPLGDATQYAHYVFKTIKHKQSGKVNFELCRSDLLAKNQSRVTAMTRCAAGQSPL